LALDGLPVSGREVITLKLLRPNAGKRRWLEGTQQAYAQALQDGLNALRAAKPVERNQKRRLAYQAARRCGLPATIARTAADEVLSKVGKNAKPVGDEDGFGLGTQGFQVRDNEKGWALRVSTGAGRDFLWFPLHVLEKFLERLPWVSGDARLFQRKGEWYVQLKVQRPWKTAPVFRPGEEHTFIGVDLGVARLVTLAAPKRVVIVRGLALRRRRERVAELCREYAAQSKYNLVSRLRAKERRWMMAVNHQVSRKIVDLAMKYPNPVIVLERLHGLRKASQSTSRTSSLQRAWDFSQLVEFICYKTQEVGIAVIYIDPRGTSTTCPKCGDNIPENIPAPGKFHCVHCGYQANGDVVAARNIAQRGANSFQVRFPGSYRINPSPG
jgi:IS605 OrfB family transposase